MAEPSRRRTRWRTIILSAVACIAAAAFAVRMADVELFPARESFEVVVKPYVQPGDAGPLGDSDVKLICWFTSAVPQEFDVEYEPAPGQVRNAIPERQTIDFVFSGTLAKAFGGAKPANPNRHYLKYVARLDGLPFDREVPYRVRQGDVLIREASFRTRASRERSTRFALVGDMAMGLLPERAVAWSITEQKPEFLVALGDIVYPSGRFSEYMHHYWNRYNDVPSPGPEVGAPLMASVPFYPVLGNHDVGAGLPETADALGAFYVFHVPKNGPGEGTWNTPLGKNPTAAARFRAAAVDSYPQIDFYSFDAGPAHFLILNNNRAANADEAALKEWASRDLETTNARWKFVCFHAPAFQSSTQHYGEQAFRMWHPLFETHGVDIVFAGHVHNYQRSVPLTFAPTVAKRSPLGLVNGTFGLDTEFDGVRNTRPKGIIHIVAGGGGANLYGPDLEKTSEVLKKTYGDNWAPFTAKHVMDRHSFVMVDVAPDKLVLQAFGMKGEEIDQIVITK